MTEVSRISFKPESLKTKEKHEGMRYVSPSYFIFQQWHICDK